MSDREEYPLLEKIDSPADLRALPLECLPQVCSELRDFLIANLSHNPGHFASSMGAIEIIVALHYVYDTPADNLVWDVGHQAYAHKILTGRREEFRRQRTFGGISGFPNPLESEADTFIAGHAGNSISAALGMAVADRASKERRHRKTVAVIGDASIGNGLAFEGLNNASQQPNDLLIILNDNDMSIDDNVGALHSYLSDLTTSAGYNRWRDRIYRLFRRHGFITDARKGRLLRLFNSLKAFISKKQNIFEGLNIRYFGPSDGHDVVKLVRQLREIKDMSGPRILHLCTVKGKGFPEAEKDPTTWHAPGCFDPATGERVSSNSRPGLPNWQKVFGAELVELAGRDPRVVGVTAAMPSGTSMNMMLARYPDRAFDVGISEGHAVTFAGGMARSGARPFVAIYSAFLQRAYDNVVHDVAIQGLPVTFCIDRAGLVGEDGVTHHGLFDIASLRVVPGLHIAAPSDAATLRHLMEESLSHSVPLALRYPRGKISTESYSDSLQAPAPQWGRSRLMARGDSSRVAVLALGPMVAEALEALGKARTQGREQFDVYDAIWVKPLDEDLIRSIARDYDAVVTVEDAAASGGFGSAVGELILAAGLPLRIVRLGVPDFWTTQGTVAELRRECGIDSDAILSAVGSINKPAPES